MPIGGAEDKSPGSDVLECFIELVGGSRARIAIVPTAFEEPQETGERYVKVFRKLGAAEAVLIDREGMLEVLGNNMVTISVFQASLNLRRNSWPRS